MYITLCKSNEAKCLGNALKLFTVLILYADKMTDKYTKLKQLKW